MASRGGIAVVAASLAASDCRFARQARLEAHVRRGPIADALLALAKETGAKSIFWNRRSEPAAIARDTEIERRLRDQPIAAGSCPGNLLFEPGTILNASGKPFQVFTPFWRACRVLPAPALPGPAPRRLRAPGKWPRSVAISALGILPKSDWALRHTGWMHNRVRMLAASFLVKHLLIPWQEGAAWFWDTLVDADLANNTMGWQWSAGCGADAAPYFRIFNPAIQAGKFDPDGEYIRRWVPELEKNYPRPIIEHYFARKRALAAQAKMKRES